jgi:muramoyltetrapeptide carboxypeptidase LdcA involved in peptidoglycan recycling
LTELTGLIPAEYPTTRRLDATAQDRAADLNTAFADPSIRAVLATIGGEDQITVVPLLDPEVVKADPKPFLGYSDNTNLLNWLWTAGVAGFTAVRPRCTWAPARSSTRSISPLCGPH